jgi:pyruvate dehydrogenase E2 component (dihydrolipoamide acetyltransferase)
MVKVDQPLVSMETAKAIVDVPSPYAGKIIQLHGKPNEIIKTGAPFITYEIEGGVVEKDKGSVVGKLETSESKWEDSDVTIGTSKTTSSSVKAMPAARALAKQMNIDLNTVKATGKNGLITVEDITKMMGSPHQETKSIILFSLGI